MQIRFVLWAMTPRKLTRNMVLIMCFPKISSRMKLSFLKAYCIRHTSEVECDSLQTNWQTKTKKKKKKAELILNDSNEIGTHNHLVRKWLSVHLRTKLLWVWISLLSLKLQIRRLLRARSSFTFRQTIERRFTLKLVRDMIITQSGTNSCYKTTNLLKVWFLFLVLMKNEFAARFLGNMVKIKFLWHIFFHCSLETQYRK